MLEMASARSCRRHVHAAELASGINEIADTGADADISAQIEILRELSTLCGAMRNSIKTLRSAVDEASGAGCVKKKAEAYRDIVVAAMNELRGISDAMELIVDEKFWPLPSYGDMLFRV
jgi:glutamine synthetase